MKGEETEYSAPMVVRTNDPADGRAADDQDALDLSETGAAAAVDAQLLGMPQLEGEPGGRRLATIGGRRVAVRGATIGELMADPANFADPEMIVPHIAARGRMTMLSAREKEGKSTFMSAAASAISNGGEFLGTSSCVRRVLYFSLEESVQDSTRRFVAMRADSDRLVVCSYLEGETVKQMEAEIEVFKPSLVVVDSLCRILGDVDSENDASAVNRLLVPLAAMVHRLNVAMVVLHHATKSGSGYRGSGAIGAVMDAMVEMTADEKEVNVRHFKGRGRYDLHDFSVAYDTATRGWTYLGKSGEDEERKQTKGQAVERRIIDALTAASPLGKAKLRAIVGGNATEVDLGIDRLVLTGRVEFAGVKTGYRLGVGESLAVEANAA